MTCNINFTKPAISYAKLACWPFVLETHWLLSSHIWSFIYSSWKKVGHQITDLYQWGRRDSGAPRGHESNQMKIKRGSWIITVKKNSHMEAIFPLRAQTQYWISLEAFFCVWNLSPISPPDTDDFHSRRRRDGLCRCLSPLWEKREIRLNRVLYPRTSERLQSEFTAAGHTDKARGTACFTVMCYRPVLLTDAPSGLLWCRKQFLGLLFLCQFWSSDTKVPVKRDQNAVPRLEKKSLNRYISLMQETLNWLIYRFRVFLLNSLLQTRKIKCNKIRGRPARGKKKKR